MGVLLSISVHCGRILHCEGTPTMRNICTGMRGLN